MTSLARVAARQIDLRRADVRRGHVEAGAAVLETLRFAQRDRGGDAIGRAIGSGLALLMAAHDAGAGQARNRGRGALDVVDRGAGGDARFLTEILELVARAGNACVKIVRRLVPPAAERAKKSLRFGWCRLGSILGSRQPRAQQD